MDELVNRLLVKLKQLKGIDADSSDDVFKFALETAVYDVLNYCHIELCDWVPAMDHVVLLMSVDLINETSFTFNADSSESEVKSLSEGDFSIGKETKAEAYQKMMGAPSFSRNYKRNLNAFRRLSR